MPKITKISPQQNNSERVSVFIDGQFCTGLRSRTFQAMDLQVGSVISCDELKKKENFFWKQTYNEQSWEREKVRIDKIKGIIENLDDRLSVEVKGFGADTTKLIEEHPEEKGIPDLDVVFQGNPNEILFKIEVTGTERLRGEGYWVRPDKIEYAENHPDELVYTALHYAEPAELIRFIKHVPGKEYEKKEMDIRGAGEIFYVFHDSDEEVLTLDQFSLEIRNILEKEG